MRRWLLRSATVLAVAALALAALLSVNTLRYGVAQPEGLAGIDVTQQDRAAAAKLARAIRFRTISHADPAAVDEAEFRAFQGFLVDAFPRVHESLQRERINGLSLIYTWPGTDPGLAPLLLTAHYDVVPVEPGTEDQWRHPPFAGQIEDGMLWGRGALDDKLGVISLLQAVETLLGEGYRPRRTVVLALGHDEEVGGARGARVMAETLAERGLHFEWMLDEGGLIAEGMIPGVDPPVALIQVAEKGYLTFELTARGVGGHSSMPPRSTAVGQLASAVDRLESRPMPARLTPPVRSLFAYLAGDLPLMQRLAMANQWLFSGLIIDQLAAGPQSNAMVRSTLAPTMMRAGVKDNVLPSRASATVNSRVLPGDTTSDVLAHVRGAVADSEVGVEVLERYEPPSVSAIDTPGFDLIAGTLRGLFPDTRVAPSLLVATTDSRHYQRIVGNIYRFRPTRLDSERVDTIHGTNERISVANVAQNAAFYRALIARAARAEGPDDAGGTGTGD